MSKLGVAFKEWAAVCAALASGRQTVLLRKGGVAEAGGVFRVEHERFWLYPTFVHQQQAGVREGSMPERPADGVVRLTHFAEVRAVRYLTDLKMVRALDALHVWSPETVEARFHYRTPGLFAIAVRVVRSHVAYDVVETPEYAGCKSWVSLAEPLTAEGEAVLSDEALESRL